MRYFTEDTEGTEYPETVECVAETTNGALKMALVGEEGKTRTCFFVPKKVIHGNSEVYDVGHSGTLVVESWFAEKEWD